MKMLILLLITSFTGTSCSERESIINGRHLKVVAAELPIVFETKRNPDGSLFGYGGPTYQLIQWLSLRLNFTYDMHVLEVFDFGQQVNGTYTGFIGHLYRKESDVALSAFGYVRANSFIDASFPWGTFDFSILIPFPEEESKTWAALKPFRLQVWLGTIGSLIAMAVTMKIFTKFRAKTSDEEKLLRKKSSRASDMTALYLIGVLTGQGGYLGYRGRSTLLLGVTWCLVAFVLVSAYSSLLISFLSTTKLIPVVDSAQELSQKLYQLPFYIFKGSIADRYITDAKDGELKALGDYLKLNPGSRKQTTPLCLNEALQHNGACITATHAIDQFVYDDFKQDKQCKLSRSKEILFPILVVLLFQKNSIYANELNYQILWATAHGLTDKWFLEEFNVPHKCLERKPGQARKKPLSFTDLRSAFLVLAIGVPISVVLFVGEILIYRTKRRF